MATINSSIFKTANKFEDIYNFFIDKGFIDNPDTDIESTVLENRIHKHLTISNDGSLLAIMSYNDIDDSKKAEKEFDNNFYVNYLILIKKDLSEYIFCKKDIGTGKILRLKKKKESLENTFLKKLDDLKFDDFEIFEKIFDRSEIIKDFYRLYCDCEKYVAKNIKGIPLENEREFFAKLLIERLMFLWFLQKKSFLDNDQNYLVNKYKDNALSNKNFYRDFLNKLFFSGLCKKENVRTKDIILLLGNIPYLNGGLFLESEIELKYGSVIEINNKIFFDEDIKYPISNEEKNVPILNLLECKEWTIDERSGDVDKLNPEILGYIFEKSINQKDLGAVYTPEEITSYICKNTIYPYIIDNINKKYGTSFEFKKDIKKEFLDNLNEEQKVTVLQIVKNLRVMDPAVGSGHFLIDSILSLETIYHYLYYENIIGWSKFEIREHIIKQNLFGIDILPGAIEICKLRMFLALAETFETKEDIHPLPNIEFNFRVGNSLIGFVSKNELNQNFISDGTIINTISKNIRFLRRYFPDLANKVSYVISNPFNMDPLDLFEVRNDLVEFYRTPQNDKDFQMELREVVNDITNSFNKELNVQFYAKFIHSLGSKKDIKKLNETNKKQIFSDLKPFHWVMEFSEIMKNGGFDIIIENPPYIRVHNLDYLESDFIKYSYKTPIGKYDIYIVFYERSFDLINKIGRIGIISSSSFLKVDYGGKLRELLFSLRLIDRIVDFGHNQIFKDVSTYTLILLGSKGDLNKEYFEYIKIKYQEDKSKISLSEMEIHKINRYNEFSSSSWNLMLSSPISVFLTKNHKSSGNLFYTRSPLFTGADEVLIKENDDNLEFLSENIWQKVIRPKDIKIWKFTKINQKVFFPYIKNKDSYKLIDEITFKNKYPSTYGYLIQYKSKLLERKDSRKTFIELKRAWYSLMRTGIPSDYESNKILTLSIVNKPRFCIDETNSLYTTGGIYALIPKNQNLDVYSYLGMFNSNVINYFLLEQGDRKRGGYIAISANLLKIIPCAPEQKTLKKIVEYILFLTENNNQDILLNLLTKYMNYIAYEIYFYKKFQNDGVITNLSNLIEEYLTDNVHSGEKVEEINKITKTMKNISNDKNINIEIDKILSHPWVKIIEDQVEKR